jgi:GNAT superfamily N-acetyltransferase
VPSIAAVRSRADLKAFIHYPFRRYRHDPYWVPPLLISEWERFNPKKNPFYEHAEIALFLAHDEGRVVGRVAAIDDELHNRTHHDNLVFFGFFEAEDESVAAALLGAVESWARERGRDAVRGPANPSMNDGAGFQIDAFDTSPYIMMPYNPPEYPAYVEALGYHKVKDLYAWLFPDVERGASERVTRLAERVRKRYNPVIRKANIKDFEGELARVKKLYNEAWEANWGFVRYTDAEFEHLARELKLIGDPDLVLFVELKGETAGLVLTLPNFNQVLKHLGGRLLPFGIFKVLNRKKYITQLRVAILGLMPEYRNKGLELVLMSEFGRVASAKGYKQGECSWVLEDNEAMNNGLEAAGGVRYKTYRIYQKAL